MRPVHQAAPRDGRVSIEVEPDLANDTEGTIASARACGAAVDRRTRSSRSPPPSRACRRSRRRSPGHQRHADLRRARYCEVMDAYLTGLRAGPRRGPRPPRSTRSRRSSCPVDTEVDKRLGRSGRTSHSRCGKAAVANALVAYGAFEQVNIRLRPLAGPGGPPGANRQQPPVGVDRGSRTPTTTTRCTCATSWSPDRQHDAGEDARRRSPTTARVLGDVVTGKSGRSGHPGPPRGARHRLRGRALGALDRGVDKFRKSWTEAGRDRLEPDGEGHGVTTSPVGATARRPGRADLDRRGFAPDLRRWFADDEVGSGA